MGTAACVKFVYDGRAICAMVVRHDGDLQGFGDLLRKTFGKQVITLGVSPVIHSANGMEELAAQVIAWAKNIHPHGTVYMVRPQGQWDEFNYRLTAKIDPRGNLRRLWVRVTQDDSHRAIYEGWLQDMPTE